jgi:opacity protein-like surface antigen
MRKIVLVSMFVVGAASGVNAQDRQTYAVASSGLTFGSLSGTVVGVELGTDVGAHFQVYAAGGYHKDVLPSSMGEDLEALNSVGLDVRAPGFLTSAGVRYVIPTGSGIRPYISLGVGAARIKAKVTAQSEDVTDDWVRAGLLPAASATEFLTEFGGGLAIPVGANLQLDLGYRFIKIRDEVSPNLSRLTVGFGARF